MIYKMHMIKVPWLTYNMHMIKVPWLTYKMHMIKVPWMTFKLNIVCRYDDPCSVHLRAIGSGELEGQQRFPIATILVLFFGRLE